MKNLGILTLLIPVVLSCSSDNNQGERFQSNNEIIFGEIYGECAGDCRNLYLLTRQGVYEDTNNSVDFGNWENTAFYNTPLSKEKFDLAKSLLEIPVKLVISTNDISRQTIADFDYLISIKTQDETKIWVFDELKKNTDSEIKQYIESFIKINNQLKE